MQEVALIDGSQWEDQFITDDLDLIGSRVVVVHKSIGPQGPAARFQPNGDDSFSSIQR